MRIGIFSDTYKPDINGVVSSIEVLKEALEKEGHEVSVITNHAGTGVEKDGDIVRLPGMRLRMLYGYNLSSPINKKANELIRDLDLDIIHLQTNFGVGLYGQRLARTLSIPAVTTYHTLFEDYTHYINPLNLNSVEHVSKEAIRKASQMVCNHMAYVIAPSQKIRDTLEEYGVYAPIAIVPSALDLEKFQQEADPEWIKQFRNRLSPEGKPIFLYLGRMADEKSIDMLVRAFGSQEDYELVLAGDGPDVDDYKKLAGKQEHPERLHFIGRVEPDHVPVIYQACDAFVSASLSETQGITYLEALASKKMLFGRRDPVLSSLIEEGVSGFYFDDEKELLEKAAVFAAMDEQQKEKAVDACLQKVAPYTPKAFADAILDVYEKSIEGYSKTYKVEKVKERDEFVELTLDHDSLREPLKLWLPYEDYIELEISSFARLEHYLVEEYQRRQPIYTGFTALKKRALSRDISAYMAREYLRSHTELAEEDMDEIISELEERGLIDDKSFAREQALLWHDMGYSKKKISMRLIKKGIDSSLAAEAISHLYSEVEERNARAMAKKAARTIKAQSARLKKQTIYRKMLAQGFESEMAKNIIDQMEFDDNEDKDLLLCYQKACRLYKNQPPAKRDQKIKLYCLKKGFTIQAIDDLLASEPQNGEVLLEG